MNLSKEFKEQVIQAAIKTYNQGQRCIAADRITCLYSDGKGNRCAVGWMLSEETVREVGDFKGSVKGLNSKGYTNYTYEELTLLSQLQETHDESKGDNFQKEFLFRLEFRLPWVYEALIKHIGEQDNETISSKS